MVIGPGVPILPNRIEVINVTAYSAITTWLVPYLTYTQERYNISYGLLRSTLSNSLLVIGSTIDNSISNMTYEAMLRNLIPNKVYYYQIRSTNSQGTTISEIMEFTTLETGK